MIEARWGPVLPHLSDFQRHLAARVPLLQIEIGNDGLWAQDQYLQQCKTNVFNRYGVYLLFAPDESLQYVGLAMNSFHDRIWSHDEDVDRRWTDLIPIEHEYYCLAPALEFFLICRLRPPKNTIYRGYTIPSSSSE